MEGTNQKIFAVNLGANDPTISRQNEDILTTNQGYVQYGIEDDQFQYLLDLYMYSPTHNAVVNALNRLVFGKGLNDPDVIKPKELRKVIGDFNSFGNYSIQQIINGSEKKLMHISTNYLRPKELEDDQTEIQGFGHSTDWRDSIEIEFIPSWDVQPDASKSVFYGRPYVPNAFYFAPPTFQGGLTYMEQEIEIGKFLLKHIKRGFAPTKIINFNNGEGDEDSRKKQVKQIEDKLAGANGDPYIVAFNQDKDHAATIDDVTLDGATEQYKYAEENAAAQIIKVHGISSPVVLGLATSNGFSSNADELREAKIRFVNDKIKPIQQFIAEGLNELTGRTDIEFLNDTAGEEDTVIEDEVIEETTLSQVNTELQEFIDLGADNLEGFELFNEGKVHDDESNDEILAILEESFGKKSTLLSKMVELVGTGKATPKRDSEQDDDDFAVRYRYSGRHGSERAFCKAMSSADKIYRKEDIIRMENQSVNPGFGKDGTNKYSIWLYKGGGLLSADFPGGTCQHFWKREIYLKKGTGDKRKADLNSKITVAESRRKGFRPEANDRKVGTTPHSNYKSRN